MKVLKKLCAALLIVLPLASFAAERPDDWLKGRLFAPDVVLKHQAALRLTDAQRQAIRREIVAVQAKVAPLDFDLMDAAVALQEELDRPQPDREIVLEKTDAALAADARKKRAWIEMLLSVRALLSAEQVAYLKKVAAEGG